MRLAPSIVLISAAVALQGCVAAAIPLVAGGAIFGSEADRRKARVEVETTPQAPVVARSETAAKDNVTPAGAPPPDSPGNLAIVEQRSGLTSDVSPDALDAFSLPETPGIQDSDFAELVTYAETILAADSQQAPRSAVLEDPSRLNPKRQQCVEQELTVLIDLDPTGQRFNAIQATKPLEERWSGLSRLRGAGVSIAWISANSAAYAGDIRLTLKQSGLDPEGKDQLLLMRYPGDRKQTRREELAVGSCLIAIAGDERADFDELFEYLVNPEAALGLELLIGDGWFLVPPLLVPATEQTAAISE